MRSSSRQTKPPYTGNPCDATTLPNVASASVSIVRSNGTRVYPVLSTRAQRLMRQLRGFWIRVNSVQDVVQESYITTTTNATISGLMEAAPIVTTTSVTCVLEAIMMWRFAGPRAARAVHAVLDRFLVAHDRRATLPALLIVGLVVVRSLSIVFFQSSFCWLPDCCIEFVQ